jgi:hypothetical protein
MMKGWRNEPARHYFAAKGIRTKQRPSLKTLPHARPSVNLKDYVLSLASQNWEEWGSIYIFGSATDPEKWQKHYKEWQEGKKIDPPDIDVAILADEYDLFAEYDDPEEGAYAVAEAVAEEVAEMFESKKFPGVNVDIWVMAGENINLSRADMYVDNEPGLNREDMMAADEWIDLFATS